MDVVLKKNFTYLFVLQNANYIIPLILLPYLTQVLGSENYGKVAFAQAFISYFLLITDFGFNTSSTQSIAIVQNDKLAVSKIFWNTIAAKLSFAILSFVLLIASIFIFPKLHQNYELLLTAYIGVLSSVFFPIWLFQGTEKMSLITILTVIPRLIILIAVFIYVKSENDYLLSLQLQMFGLLFTSLLSFYLIFKNKMVSFVKPTIKDSIIQIKQSWHIFISSVATNIYTTTNIVVLGFLSTDAIVGVFSAADKIIRAIIALVSSVTQVTFPRINVYFIESKEKAVKFAKKLILIISGANFVGGIMIIVFAPLVVKLMFGIPQYSDSILILRTLSFLPLFAVVNGMIAINLFITFNLKSELTKIVIIGGIFSVIIIFPLTYYFSAVGVAICALSTEIIIFFLFLNRLKKNYVNLFEKSSYKL